MTWVLETLGSAPGAAAFFSTYETMKQVKIRTSHTLAYDVERRRTTSNGVVQLPKWEEIHVALSGLSARVM